MFIVGNVWLKERKVPWSRQLIGAVSGTGRLGLVEKFGLLKLPVN